MAVLEFTGFVSSQKRFRRCQSAARRRVSAVEFPVAGPRRRTSSSSRGPGRDGRVRAPRDVPSRRDRGPRRGLGGLGAGELPRAGEPRAHQAVHPSGKRHSGGGASVLPRDVAARVAAAGHRGGPPRRGRALGRARGVPQAETRAGRVARRGRLGAAQQPAARGAVRDPALVLPRGVSGVLRVVGGDVVRQGARRDALRRRVVLAPRGRRQGRAAVVERGGRGVVRLARGGSAVGKRRRRRRQRAHAQAVPRAVPAAVDGGGRRGAPGALLEARGLVAADHQQDAAGTRVHEAAGARARRRARSSARRREDDDKRKVFARLLRLETRRETRLGSREPPARAWRGGTST